MQKDIDLYIQYCQEHKNNLLASMIQTLTPNECVPRYHFRGIYRKQVPVLFIAVLNETFEIANLLIKSGHNQPKVLTFLIEHGAKTNQTNNSVDSPLIIASKSGSIECLKKLLEVGENVNQHDGAGRTSLHLSCWFNQIQCIPILFQFHANIDSQDFLGRTALHISSWFGYIQICSLLLESNANVNLQDKFGFTALHYAVKHKKLDVATLLVKFNANIELKDINGVTPKSYAQSEEYTELIQMFQKIEKKQDEKLKEQTLDDESLLEKDFIEEHNRLKETILRLQKKEDYQAQQFNLLKEKYEKHHSALNLLQSHQNEIMNQLNALGTILKGVMYAIDMASPPQQTQQKQQSSSGNQLMCKWCGKNKAVMRCKQCRSPVCNECMVFIKQNGCPFCNNIQK
ncbi:ankyrin repeat protein [Histomonas meleagridis]|uniref:ankyrin repeat protein n=1 Tax=Histomonas meleagridis TaxID=135588 RepID=UPI0035599D8A|nr:ankyrin repeat protein [Histomonas meleagridis]KAH0807028.1 ankyrin repeat protein [Histomonas meleagridis]